eukprot:TRINITY_DN37877_c0_g1_i1.p1 TRINITY_DN37877_c0_g1~~TRINITY_DN37877_c0_g1_i1.p1  ORF type:complete len:466 (+),score=42.27 TRINITY_DN37877_c0_g1_i1:39-1436(+)
MPATRYSARWFMLSMFCVPSMVNGAMFLTVGAISDIVGDRFDVSAAFVNGCGQVFYLTFLVSILSGLAVLNRADGLRHATLMAGILNTVGSAIRIPATFVDNAHAGFTLMLVSNMVAAVSQAYFLTVPTLLSAQWFPESERGISTAIAGLVNQVGMAIGYFLARFFVTRENFNTTMFRISLVTTCVIAATTILIFFFFKSGPYIRASTAGRQRISTGQRFSIAPNDDTPTGLWAVAKHVFFKAKSTMTRGFTMFLLVFGINTAVYWSTGLLLDGSMVGGYKSREIAVAGTLYLAAGIPGMCLGGMFLDWSGRLYHKIFILVCIVLSAVLMALLSFSLWFEFSIWSCYLIAATLGLSLGTSQPVFLDLGVLLTPTSSETISSSLLFLFATQTGFILVFANSYLSYEYSSAKAGFYNNLFFAGLLAAISILLKCTPCEHQIPGFDIKDEEDGNNELTLLIRTTEGRA